MSCDRWQRLARGWWYRGRLQPEPRDVRFLRLTDFAGLEDSPAFSPDGKSVAFVSDSTGSRQIWIRLLAGGPPLQITHDAGDHLEPRWSQDSAAVIYYTPPPEGDAQGALWEVSALGGAPRRLVSSMSGADVSHDGKRLTFFRLNGKQMELVASDRNGSNARVVMQAAVSFSYRQPRWSPDDGSIAYLHSRENWADDVYVVASAGGPPRQVTHDNTLMSGLAWLADGSRLVYSSRAWKHRALPSYMHLWLISPSGGDPQQLTFGERGMRIPMSTATGESWSAASTCSSTSGSFRWTAIRRRTCAAAVRITHQTGQVQTPTLSPNDREMAYLSDNGGHGNLWVHGAGRRRDAPDHLSKRIRHGHGSSDLVAGRKFDHLCHQLASELRAGVGYWLIHPDGSGLHLAVPEGAWATWSGDSKWLYYSESSPVRDTGGFRLMKVPVEGGTLWWYVPTTRAGRRWRPMVPRCITSCPLQNLNGSLDYELRVARPEDGHRSCWRGSRASVCRFGKACIR